jgi:uncharacterized protein YukE
MGTNGLIKADYNLSLRKVAELKNIASELNKIGNAKISEINQGVSNSWKGNSATQFIYHTNEFQEELLKTQREVENLADKLEHNARKIYQAEMEALRIAKEKIGLEESTTEYNAGGGGYSSGGGGNGAFGGGDSGFR